jgi:spore maturation protein B
MLDYLVPGILLGICAIALGKRQDPYRLMLAGAADGLKLLKTILPTLIILLTAVTMLRVSGAVELIAQLCGPIFRWVGIPPETAILVLIRPVSGSAALAVGAELIGQYGADSTIGRTAAVMLGSTETTFYTVSVYFGAAGIRKTRYTLPAALIADLTGFVSAAFWTKIFFG